MNSKVFFIITSFFLKKLKKLQNVIFFFKKGVCRKYNVAGFPTLFAIYQGKVLAEFQGRRDHLNFDKFLGPFLDVEERKKLFEPVANPETTRFLFFNFNFFLQFFFLIFFFLQHKQHMFK